MNTMTPTDILDKHAIRRLFVHDEDSWEVWLADSNTANHARGHITYNGVRVGDFSRSWEIAETGELVMNHVYFEMTDKQGEGFGSQWLAECTRAYRNAGFNRIVVRACKIGRHAWARQGFECIDYVHAKNLFIDADNIMRQAYIDGKSDIDTLNRWHKFSKTTAAYTPCEWAAVVAELADFKLAGRSLLLHLDEWNGVMYL